MVEPMGLEPGSATDLAEDRMPAGVADVEVEQVALGRVVGREAGLGAGDRRVDVRVARHEHVEPPVAVDIGHGGAGVPPGLSDSGAPGAFREPAMPVVPEERVVRIARHVVPRRRHEEVGGPVAIEVCSHAAASTNAEAGARGSGHVPELAADVPVEAALREAPSARYPAVSVSAYPLTT